MTANQIINEWNTGVKFDLIKNYKALGLRASGKWAESLDEFNDKTPEGFKFGILGEQYTGALESGRKPNSNQDEESLKGWVGWAGSTFLKDWVDDKDLDINPYAVAWKIALEGWRVPNKFNAGGLVSNVVTDKRIGEVLKDLSLFYVSEIKSEIVKGLKNGNR